MCDPDDSGSSFGLLRLCRTTRCARPLSPLTCLGSRTDNFYCMLMTWVCFRALLTDIRVQPQRRQSQQRPTCTLLRRVCAAHAPGILRRATPPLNRDPQLQRNEANRVVDATQQP
jgi:hypothetical protein